MPFICNGPAPWWHSRKNTHGWAAQVRMRNGSSQPCLGDNSRSGCGCLQYLGELAEGVLVQEEHASDEAAICGLWFSLLSLKPFPTSQSGIADPGSNAACDGRFRWMIACMCRCLSYFGKIGGTGLCFMSTRPVNRVWQLPGQMGPKLAVPRDLFPSLSMSPLLERTTAEPFR